jgi:carbonic anhydrase
MKTMQKVFHFDTPREPYRAGAVVVWCFDHRFHLAFSKFLKHIGLREIDIVKVAGGAKSLASTGPQPDREFVLEQIRASVRLHHTRLIILMLHSDCGAYGGIASAFAGDSQAEARHHEEELRRAAACVREAIPGVEVRSYFVDFEGVWAVQIGE